MNILLTNVCEIPSILRIIKFIMTILNILLFLVPMILIIMLMIDMAKNVIAGNTDNMKKNFNVAIRRIIMVIIIFLIPNIVNIALSLVGSISDDALKNYKKCQENYSDIEIFEANLKAKQEETERERQMRNANKQNNKSKKDPIIAYDNSSPIQKNTKHNILIIGNSKTWRDGTKSYENSKIRPAYEFIKMTENGKYIDDGKLTISNSSKGATSFARNNEATIGTIGGKTISTVSGKYKKYVSDISYDIVILQEKTASAQASDNETYKKGVKKVLNMLKNKNANIYLRTSWPTNNSSFNSNLNRMNKNVDSIIKELSSDKNYSSFKFHPIRDGNAFKAAKESGINTYVSDKQHQNANGAYLAALCMYYSIFKESPNFTGHISSKTTAQKLENIAKQECK